MPLVDTFVSILIPIRVSRLSIETRGHRSAGVPCPEGVSVLIMSTEPPSTSSTRSPSPQQAALNLAPHSNLRRSLSHASVRSLAGAAPGTPILPTAVPAQLSVPDFSLSVSPSSLPSSSSSTPSIATEESGPLGILVQPGDDDADDNDSISKPVDGEEDAQKVLREQLRKSLSRRTGADAVTGACSSCQTANRANVPPQTPVARCSRLVLYRIRRLMLLVSLQLVRSGTLHKRCCH